MSESRAEKMWDKYTKLVKLGASTKVACIMLDLEYTDTLEYIQLIHPEIKPKDYSNFIRKAVGTFYIEKLQALAEIGDERAITELARSFGGMMTEKERQELRLKKDKLELDKKRLDLEFEKLEFTKKLKAPEEYETEEARNLARDMLAKIWR